MSDLKKELGLENIEKVYYARLIGSPSRIYFIFFDSRKPDIPLTSVACHRHEFASVIPYRYGKRMTLTNILPIEQFCGDSLGALFIRVDLSGRFQQMFLRESSSLLIEDMNLKDFKSAAAVSARVQATRKARKKLLGGGNEIKYVKLVSCHLDRANNFAEFDFLSQVTPDGTTKYKTDPSNNFNLVRNPSGTYRITFRMDGFFTWLLDTMLDGQPFTPKDLKDAMLACSIKMWDDDPSLYWQGFAYNLSQLDASIYEVTIPPKHWNKIHGGEYFLSKHMTALIMNIDFFLNNMTSKVSKQLKAMGILDAGFTFNYASAKNGA